MSDLNLLRYYARLTPLGSDQDIKIALADVANTLFTSTRHARNLLGDMHKLDWLSWTPKVGRNQRSTLRLKIELKELKIQLATKRIEQGKYEKALSILDNDERAFGLLLQSTSGASFREGRLHIQLTYKRPFEQLVPHQRHRSSERYLIRQIYCCLVSCDFEGRLEPQLAHHWQQDEQAQQWTFYLRPGLTFHNGTAINAHTIAELFTRLLELEHYHPDLDHLVDISAPMDNKVVFTLSQPDQGFAGLLSGIKFSIQPLSQLQENYQGPVVGSGVFEVIEHSNTRLCLQAFEQYYACRALTDLVTIWQLDEKELKQKQIETNQSSSQSHHACHYYLTSEGDNTAEAVQHTRIEDGCMFLLFNQRSSRPLDTLQQRYLSSVITPESTYRHLQQERKTFGSENAYNLLPQWHKVIRPIAEPCSLPSKISIAVYDYNSLINCAYAVAEQLKLLGIEVVVNIYSFRELNQRSERHQLLEDLIVHNINLDDNRHSSAFGSLFHNPILQASIGDKAQAWLSESLKHLRANTPLEHYLDALEPIASSLINQYLLLPIFHHRQTLRFHGVLKDVALTNWGWPDIRNVWSAD
ncbi:SgrR family transcriptional regulator [Vibrio panuliri]|uniref:Transporter n=1 Tax=Vibrio panuliri TaxID=1381081 RepID=A0A1Q9HQ57_9VIBR|nr:SgrR family transcriptional regulator [Vibrio panuliri]KAB1457883.1 SgrR family transcriptional regulator [Vibrio panuliri]OLQ93001.1 transporter [Vibrio panuliri]OLQ94491.1 transporter [Vibrio panuliri]